MKILLLLFLFFTLSSCEIKLESNDTLYCGRETGSVCDLCVKMKYQECLCDTSALRCDLTDCMQKFEDYRDIFSTEQGDAYEDGSLVEILVNTICRCQGLTYYDFKCKKEDYKIADVYDFSRWSLRIIKKVSNWIKVNEEVIPEVERLMQELDKKYKIKE